MDVSTKIRSLLGTAFKPDGSLLPLLIFVSLTILFLYPISVFPSKLVLGRPFDNVFESIGYLDWYKRALFDQQVSPLFNPDIFYPDGWDLRFSVVPPLFLILLAPITAVLGSVTTYNLIIMGSTIIAAFGVYTLHKAMGGGLFGGIYAGMLYGFYPNRQVYMSGFLNLLLASVWLPWMLLGIHQAVYQPARRKRWLLFAALCYALSISAAWQYTYISTLAVLLYGGVLIGTRLRREWRDWVKPILLAIGTIILIAGPSLIIGFQGRSSISNTAEFTLEDLTITSSSLERFLLPSAMNPLTWKLTREMFPQGIGENSMVFLGYMTFFLLLWALWRWRPWRKPEWALLTLAGGAMLFMVGPFLKWMDTPITLPMLNMVNYQGIGSLLLNADGGIKIPMPALLIYKLLPPFKTFHHFGRIGMLVALGVGILAGLGLTTFINKRQKMATLVMGTLAVGVLLMEINMQPHADVTSIAGMQRDVDTWLASQKEQSVIIEYPLAYASKSQSLYHVGTHQQKMVHGYALPPQRYAEMLPTLEQWPDEAAINLLTEIGVDYVLVDVFQNQEDFQTQQLPELEAVPQLSLVGRFSRQVDRKDVPSYLFGYIQPRVDRVKEVYLFQLQDE